MLYARYIQIYIHTYMTEVILILYIKYWTSFKVIKYISLPPRKAILLSTINHEISLITFERQKNSWGIHYLFLYFLSKYNQNILCHFYLKKTQHELCTVSVQYFLIVKSGCLYIAFDTVTIAYYLTVNSTVVNQSRWHSDAVGELLKDVGCLYCTTMCTLQASAG